MSKVANSRAAKHASVVRTDLDRLLHSSATLLKDIPIGIYVCDRDGTLLQFNRRAAEIWGRSPTIASSDARFGAVARIQDRHGEPIALEELPMAIAIRTGQAVRDSELTLERPGGEHLTLLASADPLFDGRGVLIGAIASLQDIGELSAMRRRVKERRGVGRYVMGALPVALYTTDAKGKLLFYNEAAARLWGRRPELGSDFWCGSEKIYTMDGQLLPHDQCPMAVALRAKRAQIGPEAITERPDGTRVPFLPHPTPIFDNKGEMIGAVNMLIDLSEQKQAMAQQRGLIDELNHRVKNTLATIQSLAAQTMRESRNVGERNFEARLMALSRVHDQLTRHRWEWADFAVIAHDTFAERRAAVDARVHLQGPSVRLSARAALAVAMVLHELAGNAERYGALSTATGTMSLDWRVESKQLLVDWQEQGGPAVTVPHKRGFGARLLERSIAHELGGRSKLEFAPGGVHCAMEIPLLGQ
jgi:two-component sensor histidine kinase